MSDNTVVKALTGCFTKPLNKLPREQRTIANAYVKNWASLCPDDRQRRAKEVDRQRATKERIKLDRARRQAHEVRKDSKYIAAENFEWWEASLDATAWWNQDNVTYKEAAMLLCGHDPRKTTEDEVERSTMLDDTKGEGKTWNVTPVHYKRLRDAFSAKVHTSQDRTLAYWLDLAQKKRLSYHGWIDQWLKAREVVASGAAQATTQSQVNTTVIDELALQHQPALAAFTETAINGGTIDWQYWVGRMPTLTADEAARLLCALDPKVFTNLDEVPLDKRAAASDACNKAKDVLRLAERQGKGEATPREWLNWAYENGLRSHSRFRLAVDELPKGTTMGSTPQAEANANSGVSKTAPAPTLNREQNSLVAPTLSEPQSETVTNSRHVSDSNTKPDLVRREILAHHWPLHGKFTNESFDAALSTVPDWLKSARITPGRRGKHGSATWNPALIAVALIEKNYATKNALDAFFRSSLPDWRDEWNQCKEHL